MAFDCAYRGLGIDESARLTRDAVAAAAREHGLGAVYVIAGVDVVPHRWRRRTVDVVVHLADGDDVLGMQFPDEARAAVTEAVEALRRGAHDVVRAAPQPRAMRSRQRGLAP
jgi:hypothetical protein